MRACVLATLALIGLGSATEASVITVGGSFATSCYRAAEDRRIVVESWRACDTALAVEALSPSERAGTLVNRGILHMLSGNKVQALRDFTDAQALDPRQPEIYLNQAVMAFDERRVENALGLASRALDLGTRRPELALFIRGIAHEEMGSVKAAYADLRRASELAPGWSEPKCELTRYRVR